VQGVQAGQVSGCIRGQHYPTTGPQDASKLLQRPQPIRHVVEHVNRQHTVKAGIHKWQRLGIRLHDMERICHGRAGPRFSQHT